MDTGTKNKPKFIPVHEVRVSLPGNILYNLLTFHALTGCDSTSHFSGHGKKPTWSVYASQPKLLDSFTDDTTYAFADAERFVVKVYCPSSSLTRVNDLRAELFHRITNPEKLPQTQDALVQHLKRCKHQLKVWSNATVASPILPSLEESGWELASDGTLAPILMTIEAVPAVCVELLTCGCKSKRCNTTRCTRNKRNMRCSPLGCLCMSDCMNPYQSQVDDDSDTE